VATPTPIAGSDGCVPPICLEIPPASSPTAVSCFSVVGYTQQPNCTGLEFDFPFDPAVGPDPSGPAFAPFLCRTWWGFRNPDGSCNQVLVQGAIAGPRPDCELPSWLAGAPDFIQQAWCDVQRFGEQYCNAPALQACLQVCARDTSETGGACLDCLAQWALSCTVVAVQNILNRSIQRVRDWWSSTRPKPPPRDPPIPTSLDTGRTTGGNLRVSPGFLATGPVAAAVLPNVSSAGSADIQPVRFVAVPHSREGIVPMVPVVVPNPGCGCDEETEFAEEEFEWLASPPTKQAPQLRGRESAALHSQPQGSPRLSAFDSRPPTVLTNVSSARSRPALARNHPVHLSLSAGNPTSQAPRSPVPQPKRGAVH
jgi:hypothetical protein